MSDKTTPKMPKVELATKDWTLSELRDTEGRIERAFHDQTKFLTDQISRLESKFDEKIDGQTRWMVGLMVTMTIAIMVAVLFK